MSHISKINFDSIDKVLGLKSNIGIVYEVIDKGELMTGPFEPYNKGKRGLNPSNRKGGNRDDLSPEMRKQISEKVKEYRLGKTHSEETKEKIRLAALKRWKNEKSN